MNELRRYRLRRKKFAEVVSNQICEESEYDSGRFEGIVSFPLYGDTGIAVMEKLRDTALRVYGDASVISIIKSFYRIMTRYDELSMTGRKDFEVKDRRGRKAEGNWEVAR